MLTSELPPGRPLRIWCAASSSGQEPVSLALLLREHFPEVVKLGVQILATNISPSMIKRCQSGLYGPLEVARGLPDRLLARYFQKQGSSWKLNNEVLSMIDYRQMNLTERLPHLYEMSLVMCRHVLIYFDAPTKLRILEKIRRVMGPNSILMLGAEAVHSPAFQVRSSDSFFFYDPVPPDLPFDK